MSAQLSRIVFLAMLSLSSDKLSMTAVINRGKGRSAAALRFYSPSAMTRTMPTLSH